MAEESRKSFHRDLSEVRHDIAVLGTMVTEAVTRSTDALLASDIAACQSIIDADDAADVLSNTIEDRCFRLLALQQPMAADLRALSATMRINSDLERSADLAVNIAKGARRIYGHDIPPRLRGIIGQMSEEAVRMVRLAVDAYSETNGALGAAMDDIDNRLDQLQVEFVEAMFEVYADDKLALQPAVQLAMGRELTAAQQQELPRRFAGSSKHHPVLANQKHTPGGSTPSRRLVVAAVQSVLR